MEQAKQYLSKHPDAKHYLLCAATLGTGVALSALILTIFSPYAGEIVSNFMIRLGFWINLALGVMALFMLVGFFAWNFGKGVQFTTPAVGLLAASNWPEPTIGRDTLICLRPGESEEAFYKRKQLAVENADAAHWVVVLPFRLSAGMLFRGGKNWVEIDRNNPPFKDDLKEGSRLPEGLYFSDESRTEYETYIDWFTWHFAEWSAKAKLIYEKENEGKHGIFDDLIKPSANVLFFLLFAVGLSAQGPADINRMLGKNAGIAPGAGVPVEIMFERGKSHFRTGNGKSTVTELLEGVPGFKYPKSAPVAVIVGDRIVARASAAQDIEPTTKQAAMRPVSAIPPEQVQPSAGFSLPDSVGMTEMADRAKYEIWKATDAAGKGVKPWWGVVMFTLWRVFPFLIVIGAASWLFAGVCAKEGMYDLHKIARRIFAIDALAVAVVLLVNFLLMAIDAGFGPFGLTFVAIAETALAYYVVTWLVPDFRPSPGNEPRGRDVYNPNGLPSGR